MAPALKRSKPLLVLKNDSFLQGELTTGDHVLTYTWIIAKMFGSLLKGCITSYFTDKQRIKKTLETSSQI